MQHSILDAKLKQQKINLDDSNSHEASTVISVCITVRSDATGKVTLLSSDLNDSDFNGGSVWQHSIYVVYNGHFGDPCWFHAQEEMPLHLPV